MKAALATSPAKETKSKKVKEQDDEVALGYLENQCWIRAPFLLCGDHDCHFSHYKLHVGFHGTNLRQ